MVEHEREELILQLKSEVETYRQKAKGYKQKLKVELETFKRQTLENEKNNCFKDVARLEVEVSDLRGQLAAKEKKMADLETMSIVHRKKIETLEAELEQKDAKLEEKTLEQNEKIERLTREFNKKLAIER